MVSRENRVVLVCIALALVVFYGGWSAGLGDEVVTGAAMFVGIVVPLALNGYFDRRTGDG